MNNVSKIPKIALIAITGIAGVTGVIMGGACIPLGFTATGEPVYSFWGKTVANSIGLAPPVAIVIATGGVVLSGIASLLLKRFR